MTPPANYPHHLDTLAHLGLIYRATGYSEGLPPSAAESWSDGSLRNLRSSMRRHMQQRADTVHASLGIHGTDARSWRNEALSRVALHRLGLRYPYAGCSESP